MSNLIWLVFILAGAVAALYFAVKLQAQPPLQPTSSDTRTAVRGRLSAKKELGRLHRQLRSDIDLRAQELSSKVSRDLRAFRSSIRPRGSDIAAKVESKIEDVIDEHVEDLGIFDQFNFDGTEIMQEEVLPIVLKEYEKFQRDGFRDMHKCVGALGIRPEAFEQGDDGSSGSPATNSGGEFSLAEGAAAAAAGYAAAALAGPVGIALAAAVAAIVSFKSKSKIKDELLEQIQPIIRGIFAGNGYRNPENGVLIPSAAETLQRAVADLEERTLARVEEERERTLTLLERQVLKLESDVEDAAEEGSPVDVGELQQRLVASLTTEGR